MKELLSLTEPYRTIAIILMEYIFLLYPELEDIFSHDRIPLLSIITFLSGVGTIMMGIATYLFFN